MAGYYGRPEAIKGNSSCIMCPAVLAQQRHSLVFQILVMFAQILITSLPRYQQKKIRLQAAFVEWAGQVQIMALVNHVWGAHIKDTLGSGNCKNCLPYHYSNDYLSSCTPCSDNSTLWDLKGGVLDCECKPGFFGNESWCVQCDPGTFKSSIGFEHCYDCQQGKYSDNLFTFCNGCPLHTTSPNRSESYNNCTCDAGFTIDLTVESSQLVCIPCSAGKYKSAQGFFNCTEDPLNSDSEEGASIFTCDSGFAVNREEDGCTSTR